MKKVAFRSLLFWVLLTAVVSAAIVFRSGLDLTQAHDDYVGYWNFRLVFFLVIWVPVSLPVWALGTYIVTKFKR